MRLQPHLAASAAAGGVVWAVTGDPITLPVAVAAGVLPDADHLLDYYLRYVRNNRRYYFYLLHAWEYLFAAVLAYIFIADPPWLLAVIAGYATQIGLDQFSHFRTSHATGYLLVVRIKNRFRTPWFLYTPDTNEYQSFIKSLPFGRGRAERWFEKRLRAQRPGAAEREKRRDD